MPFSLISSVSIANHIVKLSSFELHLADPVFVHTLVTSPNCCSISELDRMYRCASSIWGLSKLMWVQSWMKTTSMMKPKNRYFLFFTVSKKWSIIMIIANNSLTGQNSCYFAYVWINIVILIALKSLAGIHQY